MLELLSTLINLIVSFFAEIWGALFIIWYILISLLKALLLLLKPLWFIFNWVVAFVVGFFNSATASSFWTPDNRVLTLLNQIPMLSMLLTTISIGFLVFITVKAIRNDLE